jgi:hypothetical protein
MNLRLCSKTISQKKKKKVGGGDVIPNIRGICEKVLRVRSGVEGGVVCTHGLSQSLPCPMVRMGWSLASLDAHGPCLLPHTYLTHTLSFFLRAGKII